jgi:hypothetical protein
MGRLLASPACLAPVLDPPELNFAMFVGLFVAFGA